MPSTLQHIAIIPDGNRRWAKKRHLPTLIGHKKGYEAFEPIIIRAVQQNIPYLTFWAFSTENWMRSVEEVGYLMDIFRSMFTSNMTVRLQKNGVKLRIIGDIAKFPDDIQKATQKMVEATSSNERITVTIALGYGGREEILHAVNNLIKDGKTAVDGATFTSYLYTSDIPDPDLIIRTSGEQRLSGFMPWQGVYSELYFTSIYWPEFTPSKLDEAIDWYISRERRMGR